MSYQAAETERRGAGMVRTARVVSLDPGKARARVSFGGETESEWLPFMAMRAGAARVWAPPSVGEQVWVLSESGETAQGIILGAAFQDGIPQPSSTAEAVEVHLGGSLFIMTGDRILLSSNGSTLELDAAGIRLNGSRIDIN